MDVLACCRDLLGADAIVEAGELTTPIYVACSQQDAEALYQLIHELMVELNDPEITRLSIRETQFN